MDVENNVFTIKQIQRLMALYSKAVEFYNGKSDGKYLYYQDKLQNLITQDKVLDMLNSKEKIEHEKKDKKEKSKGKTKKIKKEKIKTDPKTKEELKEKERRMKMNLVMTNKEIKKGDVKTKIIEDHATVQTKENEIIENNLSEQKDNMKKRLEERRMRMKLKRQEKQAQEEGGQQLTNSSTPNQVLSSKKESGDCEDKTDSKGSSSGVNSVDENWTFQVNFDSLQDDKFSSELMNRLKILQEGYDDNDYDNDDLFDEEAVEEEIEQILNKWDEEVEKILEEDRQQIESLYENIANEKFEKLAEIKAEYKYLIKSAKSEDEEKELEKERDTQIAQTIKKFDEIKAEKVNELKVKHKENKDKIKIKREGIKKVTNKVRRSVSRKASRRVSGHISPNVVKKKKEAQPIFTNLVPITRKTEFSESFKIQKGPINMNDLVRGGSNNEE